MKGRNSKQKNKLARLKQREMRKRLEKVRLAQGRSLMNLANFIAVGTIVDQVLSNELNGIAVSVGGVSVPLLYLAADKLMR